MNFIETVLMIHSGMLGLIGAVALLSYRELGEVRRVVNEHFTASEAHADAHGKQLGEVHAGTVAALSGCCELLEGQKGQQDLTFELANDVVKALKELPKRRTRKVKDPHTTDTQPTFELGAPAFTEDDK